MWLRLFHLHRLIQKQKILKRQWIFASRILTIITISAHSLHLFEARIRECLRSLNCIRGTKNMQSCQTRCRSSTKTRGTSAFIFRI
jgi:hypothetical protein